MTVRELIAELQKHADTNPEVFVTWEGTLHRVTPDDLYTGRIDAGPPVLLIDGCSYDNGLICYIDSQPSLGARRSRIAARVRVIRAGGATPAIRVQHVLTDERFTLETSSQDEARILAHHLRRSTSSPMCRSRAMADGRTVALCAGVNSKTSTRRSHGKSGSRRMPSTGALARMKICGLG